MHYRYVGGIDEFLNVLRFDETDIVSNTNELEYGLTQRLVCEASADAAVPGWGR